MNSLASSAVLIGAVLLAGAAHAESVKVSDIDFSRASDYRQLDRRIETAARRYCASLGRSELSYTVACRQGVRDELQIKVAQIERRSQYAAR